MQICNNLSVSAAPSQLPCKGSLIYSSGSSFALRSR